MVEAQSELAEIYEEQRALCVKIRVEQDIASGMFRSLKLISEDDRRAAQARLDGHNAEAKRLERSAVVVREKIRSFRDENAIAVCDALVPFRRSAAERVVRSIDELLAAIDAVNTTSVSLKEAGIDAARLPAPLLDGMRTIAKSIIAARTPQEEKR
jgi:hypothetical protein